MAEDLGGNEGGTGLGEELVQGLLVEARRARDRAYAPYSGFSVGAAMATEKGTFIGANVENAAYPVGICAERVAASTAKVAGAEEMRAVAVATTGASPTPPCGQCRQFLFEFNPHMVVITEGLGGERKSWELGQLLPDAFGPMDLE